MKNSKPTTGFANVPLSLNGLEKKDAASAAADGNTAGADAGEDLPFTASSVKLDGKNAGYYSLAADAVSGTVSIDRIGPEITIVPGTTVQIGGRDVALTVRIANPQNITTGFPEADQIIVKARHWSHKQSRGRVRRRLVRRRGQLGSIQGHRRQL